MVPYLFYPLLGSLIALVLCFALFLYLKANKNKSEWINYLLGGVSIAAVATILVCFSIYYKTKIATDPNVTGISSLWLTVGAVGIVALIALLFVFFGRNSNKESSTKSITYAAICISMSFALSYIRLFRLPQGGTITLVSLLPLMLYSQMFGIRKGIVAGVIYGILQAIQDPYILHPAQFLLDYPIAFSAIGLSAIFTQKGIKGVKDVFFFGVGSLLAVSVRYFSHVISGIFAFSMYAIGSGYSSVAYGFVYNTFALVDMAIALTVGIVMLCNRYFRKVLNGVTYLTIIKDTPTEGEGTGGSL